MKTSIKLLSVVAVTLSSLASATSPAAEADAPSVVVKYDAAALATRAGVKDLHGRLRMAAQSVCTSLESRTLGLREQHDHCVRDAIRRSIADVGNQNLTNYWRYGVMPRTVAAN